MTKIVLSSMESAFLSYTQIFNPELSEQLRFDVYG
jgi:hypothetical protein